MFRLTRMTNYKRRQGSDYYKSQSSGFFWGKEIRGIVLGHKDKLADKILFLDVVGNYKDICFIIIH